MTLLDGITSRLVDTDRLTVGILERVGDNPATAPEQTVVLIHGNVSSSLFWQELMQDLPSDLRVIAIDLRGFGETESLPVDATRGVRDFSDDVPHATLAALGIETAHLVGWSMGGGVVMQYALDYPVLSLTLQAPVSPYGFGGTRRDGSRLTDDDAGCGGGGANPDFVQRLTDRDMTDESPTSPRRASAGVRRRRVHQRARGHLGGVDEHDVHGHGELPRRRRRQPELAGVRGGHDRRPQHDGAPLLQHLGDREPARQAADPVDPRHGRRHRLGRLVLRPQPPRRDRRCRRGRGRRSLPRRRWCRRPATCSRRTARRAAR
ncbi:alpha/beta fold hydrolase [Microbacterium aurum]